MSRIIAVAYKLFAQASSKPPSTSVIPSNVLTTIAGDPITTIGGDYITVI